VSRSKHTDPRSIRAARRLREPTEPRGAGDLSLRRRCAEKLKDLGVAAKSNSKAGPRRHAKLRIIVQVPASGFWHPATKNDILEVLRAAGPVALYGLRTVELVRAPSSRVPALVFGRYVVPGKILLYEQPVPPWRLPGVLKHGDARRLKSAGAVVTTQPGAGATLVDWPDQSLKRFMLEEVLLHELGHHVLQQHKGKRPVRIARTKDHEAFAARFAARQRSSVSYGRTSSS
jgi:hypothetical protein